MTWARPVVVTESDHCPEIELVVIRAIAATNLMGLVSQSGFVSSDATANESELDHL